MKKSKIKIDLTKEELERAVKDFIYRYSFPDVKDVESVKFGIYSGNVTGVSCEASVAYLDVMENKYTEDFWLYKLKHRETGLFLASASLNKEGRVILGCNNKGFAWSSLDVLFNYLKESSREKYADKTSDSTREMLQEDLLDFQILKIGEVSLEDMAFHIDYLANI